MQTHSTCKHIWSQIQHKILAIYGNIISINTLKQGNIIKQIQREPPTKISADKIKLLDQRD